MHAARHRYRRAVSGKSTSTHRRPDGDSAGPSVATAEQQLFWTAVEGCMALNGLGGLAPPEGTPSSSFAPSSLELKARASLLSSQDDAGDSVPLERRLEWYNREASSPAETASSSLCLQLASVLAADGSLGTQPIALRALQQAGITPASMMSEAAESKQPAEKPPSSPPPQPAASPPPSQPTSNLELLVSRSLQDAAAS